jgi:hypothetical protein
MSFFLNMAASEQIKQRSLRVDDVIGKLGLTEPQWRDLRVLRCYETLQM